MCKAIQISVIENTGENVSQQQSINNNDVVETLLKLVAPKTCEWATKAKLIYSAFLFFLSLSLHFASISRSWLLFSFMSQFIFSSSPFILLLYTRICVFLKCLCTQIFFFLLIISLSDNFFDLGKIDVYSHFCLFSSSASSSRCNVITKFDA